MVKKKNPSAMQETWVRALGWEDLLEKGMATTPVFFATPWNIAHQAPLSMGLPRQEYWNGLLVPSPLKSVLYSAVKLCTEIE